VVLFSADLVVGMLVNGIVSDWRGGEEGITQA